MSGTDLGGGWVVDLKDANSMALSGLSIRMALVSTLVANYRVMSPVT